MAAVRAAQLFQFLTPTVVRVSDVETAEMIKLIDNSSRDVGFAFANEVAKICSAVGISASEVIKAGKLGYPRTNVAWPGPVGGPCLEKDSYILAEGLHSYGIQPELIIAARRLNEKQPEEVISYLAKTLKSLPGFPENPIISLLGLAFKGRPATDDLRGTMAKPIYALAKRYFPQAEFRGYDPMVKPEQIRDFGLAPCSTLEQAMQGANLALIMNNHLVFSEMILGNLALLMARPGLVYDFWNNFVAEELDLPEGTGYMSLGSHKKAVLPRFLSQNIWPKNI
jgi:UDP-N-acetyl-D-mannosaminuronic acid dehydrogenase